MYEAWVVLNTVSAGADAPPVATAVAKCPLRSKMKTAPCMPINDELEIDADAKFKPRLCAVDAVHALHAYVLAQECYTL